MKIFLNINNLIKIMKIYQVHMNKIMNNLHKKIKIGICQNLKMNNNNNNKYKIKKKIYIQIYIINMKEIHNNYQMIKIKIKIKVIIIIFYKIKQIIYQEMIIFIVQEISMEMMI